jgi:hypothetical protein
LGFILDQITNPDQAVLTPRETVTPSRYLDGVFLSLNFGYETITTGSNCGRGKEDHPGGYQTSGKSRKYHF